MKDDKGPEATRPAWSAYEPTGAEVDRLIAGAREHPLGLAFLMEGDLGSVSAVFATHAFTVDAARRRLGRGAS